MSQAAPMFNEEAWPSPAPTEVTLRDEVSAGLTQQPRRLPCKLLYDEQGSELFEAITELQEYYPTRTERAIMRRHIDAMVDAIGEGALLIEYGSGMSLKTRLLLERVRNLAGYVPIDISSAPLRRSAAALREEFPGLEVLPLQADYTRPLTIPRPRGRREQRRVIYFPGSTIGNFEPDEAWEFLLRAREEAGSGGGLLIGVDLLKPPHNLVPAYDDKQGVTAAFNLNVLRRLNRELGADFDLEAFEHYAYFNPHAGRVEMHLVSLREQQVHIEDETLHLERGETIWTESSYKYTLPGFERLARLAGWQRKALWTDEHEWFSVQYFMAMAG